jgi:hypothetical protein
LRLAKTRGLALGFLGCRNAETHSCYTNSGFRIPRFCDWRRRGVLPFGFPGAETPKPIHAKSTHLQSASGFRVPGFRDLRKRGVLTFGFSGVETPKPIHAKPAHLQSTSGFRVPGFCDLRKRGVLPFGFLGAEMPKPIHAKPTHLQSASGFTKTIVFSRNSLQLWNARELPGRRCLREIKPGHSASQVDGTNLKGMDSYSELIHSIHKPIMVI